VAGPIILVHLVCSASSRLIGLQGDWGDQSERREKGGGEKREGATRGMKDAGERTSCEGLGWRKLWQRDRGGSGISGKALSWKENADRKKPARPRKSRGGDSGAEGEEPRNGETGDEQGYKEETLSSSRPKKTKTGGPKPGQRTERLKSAPSTGPLRGTQPGRCGFT